MNHETNQYGEIFLKAQQVVPWYVLAKNVELAQSYGQIDNTVENSKETILQIVEGWYVWAKESQNYGFFVRILEEFRKKIKNDAQHRATDLENSLNVYLGKNASWEENELISKAVVQIRERIDQQNYAAAEDLLNRVLTQDLDLDVTVQQEDYLSKFLDEYDVNYRKTANSGATLKSLVSLSKTNKDNRGGNRLLENWPRGVGSSDTMIKNLLSALGFNLESVRSESSILGKIDNYTIILKRPQNGRKSNYKRDLSYRNDSNVYCVFFSYAATYADSDFWYPDDGVLCSIWYCGEYSGFPFCTENLQNSQLNEIFQRIDNMKNIQH